MGRICVITGERGAGKSRYCLRLLEDARPGPAVNALLAFHLWMERRLVREPHVQMVEVDVYACNAARENDR